LVKSDRTNNPKYQESGRLMNKRISDFGAAVSMFVCIFGEIVFSGALKSVYNLAGNSAFICFLIAGGVVVSLSPLLLRAKTGFVTMAICSVYLLIVVSRLATSMALFQSKGIIIAVLVMLLALCLLAFGVKLRGAAIFTAVCFVAVGAVFILCCVLGIGEYRASNISPVFNNGIKGVVLGSVNAFSVLFPLTLPLLYVDAKQKKTGIITLSACCFGIIVSAFLGSLAFGLTASNYQSVIAEISKNVSFGKFFQRLEGLADAVYILTATATIVLLSAMVGSTEKQKVKQKLSFVIFSTVLLILFAVAFLSINLEIFYAVVQTVSFAFGLLLLLLIPDMIKLKRIVPVAIALCMTLTLCSCNGTKEIENSVYVVITACNSDGTVSLITESGKGGEIYTATANNLADAKGILECKHSIELTYSQMSGVLINDKYGKTSERIKEIINSSIPNSAVVYLYEGDITKLYEKLISTYESAFDFVSSLKLGNKEGKTICTTVSKVNTNLAKTDRAEVGIINEEGYAGSTVIKNH